MEQSTLEAYLGRPLTTIEATNRKLYLKIAREQLEGLICTSLCDDDDPKVYDARDGYHTVFTDIFTELEEVKVNGEVVEPEKYSPRQWDKRSASWYNSIVFDTKPCGEVEVSASWGFSSTPSDLQSVLAGLFDLVTKKNKSDATISSKQVEDFRISFNADVDLDQAFRDKYAKTLSKYSICDMSYVRNGKVCNTCNLRSCVC